LTQDPPAGNHPIHIIVKNNQITLEGVVDTEGDKTLAGAQANSVNGAMKVTNNLRVGSSDK
jgi:osmotically-inducible protein OsmY